MSKQQKHFRITIPRWKPGADWFHDPVLENPLDAEMENLISTVGERLILTETVKRFGIQLSFAISELTDGECRKVYRALVRNAEDYSGPEMKQ